jgi:hypothetical protein
MIEYKCIRLKNSKEETEEMLNQLSKDGWELICSCSKNNILLILKRWKFP